jgi:hypothetical protein
MLLTDSDVISTATLQSLDSECSRVAAAETPPIQIEGPDSIIRRAVTTCGDELKAAFQNFSGYLLSPSMNINHVAAVMNVYSAAISRPRFRLNQVVAIEPDPSKHAVRRWIEYSALEKLYRSAFHRFVGTKNGDRYEAKMIMYAEEKDAAWRTLRSQGIPVVLIPLPCPGALREFDAGTFGASNVSPAGSGSSDPGGKYLVAITWVGQPYVSPTNKANAESAGSAQVAATTVAGQVITVTTTGLTPPTLDPPAVGTAEGLYTRMLASSWNCYAGTSADALYLQNATPIPLGTTSYTLADKPALSGNRLQPGQWSDYNFSWQHMLQRS